MITKCSLDMVRCEYLDEIKLDLCTIFKKGTPLETSFMKKAVPPLSCPFEGVSQ